MYRVSFSSFDENASSNFWVSVSSIVKRFSLALLLKLLHTVHHPRPVLTVLERLPRGTVALCALYSREHSVRFWNQ